MAQAPTAWTTSSVSRNESRPSVGASRMPESEANAQPMTHDAVLTRRVRVPARLSRLGLSTTARMATPRRLTLRKKYNPATTTQARTTEMIWAYVTLTPEILIDFVGRNCG